MPRLVWLTDLHLDFVPAERWPELVEEVRAARPDGMLIGGDIATADSFAAALRDLSLRLDVPIWFVLGNHDYYGSSIAQVRQAARELSGGSGRTLWLPQAGVVALGDDAAVVGHDGWGDGRIGDFFRSRVVLNDYRLIDELREAAGLERTADPQRVPTAPAVLNAGLLQKLHALGDEAADHFRRVLPEALESVRHVYALTHVPPFREACLYQGRTSDDNWAPHFTCRAVGEALVEIMEQHPDRRLTVLCGHTHHEARAAILPNLEVFTGGAEYGAPRVQRVFDV